MTCILVALVITCTGPSIKTTPAEAIAILGPPPAILLAPARPVWRAPLIDPIVNPATDGPFGNFPVPMPFLRLDGSSWIDPPWIAVAYPNYPYGYGGFSRAFTSRSRRQAQAPSTVVSRPQATPRVSPQHAGSRVKHR